MARVVALRAPVTAVLAAAALLCLPAAGSLHLRAESAAALNGLKVTGNRITDASGTPVMLRGVNRSGTEYACQQGWGIFDGDSDLASVQAIASWHVNYVRVLLNEDCWLNINGMDAQYAGANYQNAIIDYVNLLNANGMYVELSLMFGAPGTHPASYQPVAPDWDHSPALWTSVATTFKSYPDVFFGIWGEPVVSWSCWLSGCANEATWGPSNILYRTAGSQDLVTAIRGTGATQVISVPGINYANDLSQWLAHEPADPLNRLIAEEHVYGNNTCGALDGGTCLNGNTAPLAATVPVIFGETGETYDASECTSTKMQFLLPWADAHHIGYAVWTWDTWGFCDGLISSYDGTPNTTSPAGASYGTYVRAHLGAVAGGRTAVTPAAPPSPGGRSAEPSSSGTPAVRLPVVQPAGRDLTRARGSQPRVIRMAPGFYRALITG